MISFHFGEPIKYQTEDCTGDQTYYAKWEIVDANYAEVILDEILPLEIDKDIYLPVEYQGALLYWSSSGLRYFAFTVKS